MGFGKDEELRIKEKKLIKTWEEIRLIDDVYVVYAFLTLVLRYYHPLKVPFYGPPLCRIHTRPPLQ